MLGPYITGVLQVFLTPQAAVALVVKLSSVISKETESDRFDF